MSEMRLQRYLAMGGAAARRKAEDLITAGRVKVNGEVVRELGTKVDTEGDSVTVDDEPVYPQEYFYILLNKPKACITTVSDDQGRATVMDYLPNLPVQVKPVGRLDYYSEGVLLLTNDGELASKLLSPQSHVAKTYHVKVKGTLGKRELSLLGSGVRLDDGSTTKPAEVQTLPSESKHSWVQITLYEGKSRQIHRMMEALGFEVTKLQRVSFGGLTFHGLRVGDARELKQDELNALRAQVGLGNTSGARGKWTARREDTELARRARKRVRDEAEATAEVASRPAAAFAEAGGAAVGPGRPAPPQRPAARAGRGERSRAPGRVGRDAPRDRVGPLDTRRPARGDSKSRGRAPREDSRAARAAERFDARPASRPGARPASRPGARPASRPGMRPTRGPAGGRAGRPSRGAPKRGRTAR